MKKIILATIFLTLAFGLTTQQEMKATKQVQAETQTISRQPKGQAYAPDLTINSKATIYELANDIDYRPPEDATNGETQICKDGETTECTIRVGSQLKD